MCPKVTAKYKTEIREKIIRSAIENFAKNGFDKTKMGDIAKTAKLSKGTPYLYFKSKDDLFYAICEYNLHQLKEQLSFSLSKRAEDLVSDAERIYNFFTETSHDTNAVWLEMVVESTRKQKLHKALNDHREKIRQVVTEFVTLQVEKGIFRKDVDIESVALGMMCLYEGLTASRLLKTDEGANRKAWKETMRAIFAGIS